MEVTPYVGEVRMFAGDFAPMGWALCSGQLVSLAEYQVLFTLLGTSYGGDGVNTFGIPDLRGRAPIHFGTGPGQPAVAFAQKSGTEQVTMIQAQMPTHSHPIGALNTGGNSTTPVGTTFANTGAGDNEYTPFISGASTNVTMGATAIVANGGSQPYSILQPSLCISFIIALVGIFPSQS